jgi:hybrid cluster-associated redox disulfide protein
MKKSNKTKKSKQRKIKEEITKDMIISKIVQKHPELVETFFRNGLFCVGCHQAASETLEQACQVHGINVNKLLKQLNKTKKKPKKKK